MKNLVRNKHFVYPLCGWLLVCVWFFIPVFSQGVFDRFKVKTKDYFTRAAVSLNINRRIDKEVVVVVVDDETLAYADMKWPWKRSYHANLISEIQKNEPKAVGIDFIFNGRSTEKEDMLLAEELAKHNNIVLAEMRRKSGENLSVLSDFTTGSTRVGYVNRVNDLDDVIRKMTIFLEDDSGMHFPFEMQLLSIYKDIALQDIQIKDNVIYLGLDKAISYSENGQIDINYKNDHNGYVVVSAKDVMAGKLSSSIFKDKIVLIGASAPIIHDLLQTPFGTIPGIFVLANGVSMFLQDSYLQDLPYAFNILLVLLLGTLIFFVNRKKGFVAGFVTMAIVFPLWFALMLKLRTHGLQMDYFIQFALIFAAFLVSNIYKYSYLIHISTKLKNLAVSDSVTGFYSIRYLSLLLDQKIKLKEKDLSLVAMGIREYKFLSKRYGFEEMKSFMRGFARFLETQLKHKVKKPIFARAYGGNFYMLASGVKRENLQTHLDDLMHQVWSSGFSFGDKAEMIHLSIAIAYTPVYKGVSGKYMYTRAEEELASSVARKDDSVVMLNVHEKIWDVDRSEGIDDELEFLSVDIEERNKELEEALKETDNIKRDVEEAYFAVVMSLVKALEEKDTYTQGHSERAAKFARSIAKEVGMSTEECDRIYKAGLLHDIGKIGVPETVLHKKGQLTDEEFGMIKRHPVMGKKILEPIKAFEDILPMVLHHHEKHDGTGYPHGLHADMIPVGAQILAVADCFDAITCGRGYKQGTSLREGMKELERCAGTQFNPIYVQAFKRVLNMT